MEEQMLVFIPPFRFFSHDIFTLLSCSTPLNASYTSILLFRCL